MNLIVVETLKMSSKKLFKQFKDKQISAIWYKVLEIQMKFTMEIHWLKVVSMKNSLVFLVSTCP